MLMQMSFSTWGSVSRTHSLFVCWLVLGKDKQTFSCAAWTLEQLKPKSSIGTERKFESAEETCSRSARISADPTNGITWAWTPCCTFPIFPSSMPDQEWCSTLQEQLRLQNCILPCPGVSPLQPCPCWNLLNQDTFGFLLLFLHLSYAPTAFFGHLFLPTGRSGEGVNSPAPITLPSSHPAFLSCTHLTLQHHL